MIEDNHIHHINNKQNLAGAEIGGIKMHAAIDVTIRRNHFHHCTRGLWLDWQAQGTRVTGNLFHDNVPPAGTRIADDLALGEDIFIEVSHGPTLIDHNLLLSDCAARISTQGIAFVHNLIAGSFTWVGDGTDNGGRRLPTPRYTPYHVPHRTEVAGFMTILHGDARFYNNIFVQKKIRPDLTDFAEKTGHSSLHGFQFVCGTKPYDGYPTAAQYFSRFTPESAVDHEGKDIYYDHLPVYTGGNVYFNGASPCDSEEHFRVDTEHPVTLSLTEDGGAYRLKTDLYRYIPDLRRPLSAPKCWGKPSSRNRNLRLRTGRRSFSTGTISGKNGGSVPSPAHSPAKAKPLIIWPEPAGGETQCFPSRQRFRYSPGDIPYFSWKRV